MRSRKRKLTRKKRQKRIKEEDGEHHDKSEKGVRYEVVGKEVRDQEICDEAGDIVGEDFDVERVEEVVDDSFRKLLGGYGPNVGFISNFVIMNLNLFSDLERHEIELVDGRQVRRR